MKEKAHTNPNDTFQKHVNETIESYPAEISDRLKRKQNNNNNDDDTLKRQHRKRLNEAESTIMCCDDSYFRWELFLALHSTVRHSSNIQIV